MNITEKLFKITASGTTVKNELLAGLTTFFTMSYLFILSPKIFQAAGLDFNVTLTVTCLITFIGCTLMGLIANKPYAVAPYIGETAFVVYTLVCIMGFSIKTVFAAIFVSGIILLIMTLFNIRKYIVDQIPEAIKLAFCSGLGLFFIFISLKDIGIIDFNLNAIPLKIGNFLNLNIILGLLCFSMIIILAKRRIKAGILISIAITTILGIIFKDIKLPTEFFSVPCAINICQLDFHGLLNKNFISALFVIFLLINIDTAGAIVSLSYEMKDSKTNIKKSMIADSFSVILAPIIGTTTSGAYLDSITGIKAGGKTGLTAITVGILFLAGIFFSPILSIIPPYAYAPALLYVGILMTSAITKIDFTDITEYAPAVFSIAVMIFSYNIGCGIIAAFLLYPIIQILSGQKEKTNIVSWIMFIISLIFFSIYPY